ncbi:ribosome biogenesis factor YjgA [Aliidiomarina taiwanensis]|nr:ribosome biogenesis factor YjgA [Aliidiomarina taiwanensis]
MSEDKTLMDDDLRPSKSERKREVLALTDLGRQLVDMSPHELAGLPISSSLMEAIKLAQRVRNKHAAFKRQIQYIGKLIRSSDAQAILDAMDARQQAYLVEQKHFHALEQWRDRLISEGDAALHDVLEQWPHIDRQHLRQLIRTAQKQAETNKPPTAARELFKYLREVSQA